MSLHHRELLQLRDGGQVSLDWLMYAREDSTNGSDYEVESANRSNNSNGVPNSKLISTSSSRGTDGNAGPKDLEGVIVLILPGLTGSSQSEYVKGLVLSLTRLTPATCVVLNNRGTGGIKLMVSHSISCWYLLYSQGTMQRVFFY